MKKELLLQLLLHQAYVASEMRANKYISLMDTIRRDSELKDIVCVSDFKNEVYELREIKWISQILNFKII